MTQHQIHPAAKMSKKVQDVHQKWDIITDLLGGTKRMREKGTEHLPKRKLEDQKDYEARLAISTLNPAYAETIKIMVGRVFTLPVQYEKLPAWVEKEVIPDANRQGQNFHALAQEVFEEAINRGITFVLVDSPAAPDNMTMSQQKALGVRPYTVHVRPNQVLGWTEQDGVLSQVRIKFKRTIVQEFDSIEVDEVRVYDQLPGKVQVRIFLQNEKGEYVEDGDTTFMKMDRIPIVPFYTNRTGFFEGSPPLMELAYLNLKHWRIQSSMDGLLDVMTVPILAVIGADMDEGKEIVIGARHAVELPEGADMKFIEHTGKAIETGMVSLKNLDQEMRAAGAKLIREDGPVKTVIQSRQDSSRENSSLGRMVQSLEDSLDDVLYLVGAWRNETNTGNSKVRADLNPDVAPNETMTVLNDMADSGRLSNQTVFDEAKRRNMISDEVNWEDEDGRIREQNKKREKLDDPPNGDDPPVEK